MKKGKQLETLMDQTFHYNFEKMTDYHGAGWFIDFNYNLLCRFDYNSGSISVEDYLPAHNALNIQYRRMVLYKDFFVMVPFNSTGILIYNIKEKKCQELKLESSYMEYGVARLSNAFVYKNKIFFIPGRYQAIVCLDMDSYKLHYITNEVEQIINMPSHTRQRAIFSQGVAAVENMLYIPLWQCACLLALDMDLLSGKLIKINIKEGLWAICKEDNGGFLISAREKSRFLRFTLNNNAVQELLFERDHARIDEMGYSELIQVDSGYIAIPAKGNQILWLNPDFNQCRVIYQFDFKYINGVQKYAFADRTFVGCTEYNKNLYMCSQYEGMILAINLEDFHVRKISTEYPLTKEIFKQLWPPANSENAIRESRLRDLESFLENI